ncbi:alpha-tocopherol transfer protein [Amyelois transitella]|uniref:alpha-tocopherol transfer protein n=1 Tax=Amyelois transitella TaxID=680683 RepID=UPI0029901FA1|nr:alpha-tocopherol transfer protein [Amyelois transitella]XP_013184235.2 alpha-tocopherol transfer protein [Amyelois transitella]XP_060806711.1 alpha-tocopherol transfer protein [Amyelois transitella]
METVPYHPIVKVTAEEMRRTREFYNQSDTRAIAESVKSVRDWMEKQPHLAEASRCLSDGVLERFYLLARCSVEGTKNRIEKLFTSRGLMPELSLHRNIKEFDRLLDCVNYIPLPKINTKDLSRVMITQFVTDKLEEFSILTYFRLCFMIGEYRLHYDYTSSEQYIIDLKNIHFGLLTKLNPIVIKKAEVLCTEGFGTKISGIHILNAPSFIDRLVSILKASLKEKVANRIHVHSTYEDLYSYVPKEILPKDYGGDEKSCAKLAEQWKEVLHTEEAAKIIANTDKMVTDESKRDGTTFNQEYMGMPGSFRKLNVD